MSFDAAGSAPVATTISEGNRVAGFVSMRGENPFDTIFKI
jgi:hypothetical protein